MAKANVGPSFWGEMASSRYFKPTQGRIVRQVTGVVIAVVFVLIAWRLHAFLGSNTPDALRLSLPTILGIAGCWLAFRAVNWPPFANFLISVEAEMDKVSWASLDYLKRATAVVLVCMIVLGGYLFFCDVFWQQLFQAIGFLVSPSDIKG